MFLVAVFVVLLSVLYLLFSQQDAAVDDQVCAALDAASLPACQPLAACILRSLTG